MLIHFQFPIVDLRGFVGAPRLPSPNWPTPLVNEEFMRAAGIVCRRRRGGLTGWVAEENYCAVRRALRIEPIEWAKPGLKTWHPTVLFRRFHFDGTAVAKFELGLEVRRAPNSQAEFESLLLHLFDIQAAIPQPRASSIVAKTHQTLKRLFGIHLKHSGYGAALRRCPLLDCGKLLASHYFWSTTPHGQRANPNLVTSGTPVIFIVATARELSVSRLSTDAHRIGLASKGYELFHWWRDGRRLSHIWVCINQSAFAQDVRNLRIYVLRLNAEQQAFTRTLKAINIDTVQPKPGSQESEILQTYLNDTTSNILSLAAKTRKFAENNSDLLAVVAAATEETISANERESLTRKLELLKIRKNIFRKVQNQAGAHDMNSAPKAHQPPQTVNTVFYIGRLEMTQQQSAVLAFIFGVLFVSVLLVVNLVIPSPSPTQWITFRIILALAGGGVGAMIPGILNVDITPNAKFALHAGGALAVFVIVFFFSPGLPPAVP